MPKITGPNGVEEEISMEEFQEMMRSGAQVIGIQQVITDQKTGKVVNKYNIPRNPDGSFDVFGGGMFGAMFGDHRSLEEKIADGEAGDEETMENLAMLYLNGGLEADPEIRRRLHTGSASWPRSKTLMRNLTLVCFMPKATVWPVTLPKLHIGWSRLRKTETRMHPRWLKSTAKLKPLRKSSPPGMRRPRQIWQAC